MVYVPTTDPKFIVTLETWLRDRPELLLLIRYSHAAGSKDFELFTSIDALTTRIGELPPLACVTVFRQPQLPLRGIVDGEFITACLDEIPDGAEFLVVETVPRSYGRESWMNWFHHGAGDSHAQLREVLGGSQGIPVAAGLYPPWLVDTDDVVSAVVPDANGETKTGTY